MLKEFAMTDGSSRRTFSYYEHPELANAQCVRALIQGAKQLLAGGAKLRKEDQALLFKAVHASGFAAAKAKGNRRNELCSLYDRLVDFLVHQNLGLVYEMRRKVRVPNVDADDLLSEGLWRLFEAVRHFDPWRGFQFSTYACTSIIRGFLSVRRKRRCEHETLSQVCESKLAESAIDPETIADREPEEQISDFLLGDDLPLSALERFILARRVVHPRHCTPDTLKSIGAMCELSKERIRQIQSTSIEKLRRLMHVRQLAGANKGLGKQPARNALKAGRGVAA